MSSKTGNRVHDGRNRESASSNTEPASWYTTANSIQSLDSKSGRVAAAGLGVFEGEPRLHPEYVSLKNTFLLPHIGSATVETRTAMGMLALDNVDAMLNGGSAPTLVRSSFRIGAP